MTLRLLHTADWHLGVAMHGASRREEHSRFLSWLLKVLDEEPWDALLIAGDVFEHAQPANEAAQQYYEFLARAADTKVRQIVVVGGNHDSPSRIDAPSALLGRLRVHVVGGLRADSGTWERCLCPLYGADGEVCAVVVAVPYVHEYRLGIRTTALGAAALRKSYADTFRAFYSRLAELAQLCYPGVPLVATGHLTAEGSEEGDYGTDIHQVAAIGGFPGDVFDRRFRYVGLGHIHRSFQVPDSCAWYAGSPIPVHLKELEQPRRVLQITVPPSGPTRVEPRLIPLSREIRVLTGSLGEVAEALAELTWSSPLPPYVHCRLSVEGYEPAANRRLFDVLEARTGTRPVLVEIRQENEAEPALVRGALKPLAQMEPEQVFRRLVASRQEVLDDELLAAFRTLMAARPEQLAELAESELAESELAESELADSAPAGSGVVKPVEAGAMEVGAMEAGAMEAEPVEAEPVEAGRAQPVDPRAAAALPPPIPARVPPPLPPLPPLPSTAPDDS